MASNSPAVRPVVRIAALAGLAVLGLATSAASAQLYSNALRGPGSDVGLSTGAVSLAGFAAPPGTEWAEVGHDNVSLIKGNTIGIGHRVVSGTRYADDFTIPAGETWTITAFTFFGYQTGAQPGASSFTHYNFRVWDGEPGQPGSNIVFGDDTTNRLTESTDERLYRISNAAPNVCSQPSAGTTRPVFRNVCGGLNLTLDAGTYWVDVQSDGSINSGPWIVPLANLPLGSGLYLPGSNGIQFEGGVWFQFIDEGRIADPVVGGCIPATSTEGADMPFLIDGMMGGGCEPDLTTGAIAGQPGYGVPNGVLNNDDFFYYLAQFAAGNLAVADLTTGAIAGQPGYGVPNGVLNNDDFFYYLAIFAAGC
ncbi:MAG: GC-type dockerin domain-anchored protein [Phycisphaerales bacterium]